MSRRRIILMAIAIAVVVAASFVVRPRETYESRLRKSLLDTRKDYGGIKYHAVSAVITEYDSNAVPVLMTWVEESIQPLSSLKQKVGAACKQMNIKSGRIVDWANDVDRRELGTMSLIALQEMGLAADPALPQLEALAKQNTNYARFIGTYLSEMRYRKWLQEHPESKARWSGGELINR